MRIRRVGLLRSTASGLLAFALLDGARTLAQPDGFTQLEWEIIQTFSPLPDPPPDLTNRFADNRAAARLAQMIFFDPRYSGPLQVDSTMASSANAAR